MNNNELLDEALFYLLKHKPFYAYLATGMHKQITTRIPTIGVNVTNKVNLYVNPYFWQNLTLMQQVGIIEHEIHHVICNHFSRYKEIEPNLFDDKNKKYDTPGDAVVADLEKSGKFNSLNQAADYAINEYNPYVPDEMEFFDKDGNKLKDKTGKVVKFKTCKVKFKKGWDKKQSLEYYYGKIKEETSKQNQSDKGDGEAGDGESGDGEGEGNGRYVTVDDHSIWNENHPNNEFVKEKIKQAVNNAVLKSGGLGAGKVPSELVEAINALNHVARDWRSDLRRFIAKSAETITIYSKKKRNRRYGLLYPGTKNIERLHIGVCVDTSGSMCGEPLEQVGAELLSIAQNNVNITVVEADCTVQKVWTFDKKKFTELKGGGGTQYGPALEKCKELGVDAIIYLGDLDCADSPQDPKIPVLWGATTDQKPPGNFGKVVRVEIKKKNG